MTTFSSPSDSIFSSQMDLIYSNKLTSPATSVSTGTLPVGGYKAYRVYTSLRSTGTYNLSQIPILFNGDAIGSSNYVHVRAGIRSDNVFVGNPHGTYPSMGPMVNGANVAATEQFAFSVFDIQDPEATDKFKLCHGQSYGPSSSAAVSTNQTRLFAVGYTQMQAITSIEFNIPDTTVWGSFVSGCSFYIYGMK